MRNTLWVLVSFLFAQYVPGGPVFPVGGGAPIARDTSAAYFDSSGSEVSSFPSSTMNLTGVTAGDVIVVGTTLVSGPSISISDTNGTPVTSYPNFVDSGGNQYQGWCVVNANAGTHGFKITLTGGTTPYPVLWAIALKHANTSNPCYSGGAHGGSTGTSLITGTFGANATDMIVAFGTIGASGTFASGTTTLSYALDSASPGCNCGMEYAIQPTNSSSVQASFSNSVSGAWGMFAIPVQQ